MPPTFYRAFPPSSYHTYGGPPPPPHLTPREVEEDHIARTLLPHRALELQKQLDSTKKTLREKEREIDQLKLSIDPLRAEIAALKRDNDDLRRYYGGIGGAYGLPPAGTGAGSSSYPWCGTRDGGRMW